MHSQGASPHTRQENDVYPRETYTQTSKMEDRGVVAAPRDGNAEQTFYVPNRLGTLRVNRSRGKFVSFGNETSNWASLEIARENKRSLLFAQVRTIYRARRDFARFRHFYSS